MSRIIKTFILASIFVGLSLCLAEPLAAQRNKPYEIKNNMIVGNPIPMVVDVYADWCGPCKQFAPIFHKVSNDWGDILFISLNADEYPELCQSYGITSIPTVLFLKPGGEVYKKVTGLQSEEELDKNVTDLQEDSY